jgi:hypothetical protein
LVRAADGRSVIIVTIPFKRDLLNLRDRGAPPLPAWFRQMSKDLGFTFVDLLPIWLRRMRDITITDILVQRVARPAD